MNIKRSQVTYSPHSMMHRATIKMDPTKLELLDQFEKSGSGHLFTPKNSNIRIMITGRDWSEMHALIYGSSSTEEAKEYTEKMVSNITGIGHNAVLVGTPKIANIAVSGDFNVNIRLDKLSNATSAGNVDVEYEPEQIPAAITKLEGPESTFMIYSNGKFIIQGLNNFSDIDISVDRMVEFLNSINNL